MRREFGGEDVCCLVEREVGCTLGKRSKRVNLRDCWTTVGVVQVLRSIKIR
jgi:hypothetical protein